MAVLTDLQQVLAAFKRDATAQSELRALNPTKHELLAAINALDAWFDQPAVKAAIKTEIDSGLGATSTNTLAKKIAKVWMMWRWRLD